MLGQIQGLVETVMILLSVINAIERVDMRDKFISKWMLLVTSIIFILIPYTISRSQESPHSAMEANPKDEGNCLFCHSEVPKEGEKNPNYLLNSEPSQVCLVCHS